MRANLYFIWSQSESFQADLYPPTASSTASLTPEAWLSGSNASPILINLENGTPAPASSTPYKKPTYTSSTPATPVATPSKPTPVQAAAVVAPSPVPTPKVEEVRPVEAPKPVYVAPPVLSTPTNNNNSISNGSSSNGAETEALKAQVEGLKKENERVKLDLAEKETVIRELELQLEKVRHALMG